MNEITQNSLENAWVSGLIDGEGSFTLNIHLYGKNKHGICIRPTFSMSLHHKDQNILQKVMRFIGVGEIIKLENGHYSYQTTSVNDAMKIVGIFNKENYFYLKKKDYEIWRESVSLINNNQHRNYDGLMKILKNREELNKCTKSKRRIRLKDLEKFIDKNYKKRPYTHNSSIRIN